MEITPKDLTIGQLFANYNEQFCVPAYQRRYAWKDRQYEALFDDIDLLDMQDKHLFGTILFNTGFFKGGLNIPEIVDGQQRIITLSLLLLAIKNRYIELKDKKKAEEVEKYLISKDYDEKVRNKLVLGDLDNADYNQIMLDVDNTIVNQNLLGAYKDLLEWLREFETKKELNQFYFKLTNNCIVIRLDINDAKNVYKLFEIINNRGLKLSATDIIKNFILGHASQVGDKTLDKTKRLWADIIINLDGINTDNFLRQYLASVLTAKVSKGLLVQSFKDYYKKRVKDTDMISGYGIEDEYGEEDEEDIENSADEQINVKSIIRKVSISSFLKEIKAASNIYSKIISKNFSDKAINNSLYDLERIQSLPANIFFLSLFSHNFDINIQRKALEQIKTFMMRRNICEARTGELDSIFARLAKIEGKDILRKTKKMLEYHLPSNEEFSSSFQKHQFKGKNKERAKYVLEQIEYHLTKNKNEYVINCSEEVHLEHIMPQNIVSKKSKKIFGDWENYIGVKNKGKHLKYLWRIGNLTLLSDELNIGASNNPFFRKKSFYKQSSLALNKEIVKNYSQFKISNQEKRGKELAEIALKIWKL